MLRSGGEHYVTRFSCACALSVQTFSGDSMTWVLWEVIVARGCTRAPVGCGVGNCSLRIFALSYLRKQCRRFGDAFWSSCSLQRSGSSINPVLKVSFPSLSVLPMLLFLSTLLIIQVSFTHTSYRFLSLPFINYRARKFDVVTYFLKQVRTI